MSKEVKHQLMKAAYVVTDAHINGTRHGGNATQEKHAQNDRQTNACYSLLWCQKWWLSVFLSSFPWFCFPVTGLSCSLCKCGCSVLYFVSICHCCMLNTPVRSRLWALLFPLSPCPLSLFLLSFLRVFFDILLLSIIEIARFPFDHCPTHHTLPLKIQNKTQLAIPLSIQRVVAWSERERVGLIIRKQNGGNTKQAYKSNRQSDNAPKENGSSLSTRWY